MTTKRKHGEPSAFHVAEGMLAIASATANSIWVLD
jgi:hypothetical protein